MESVIFKYLFLLHIYLKKRILNNQLLIHIIESLLFLLYPKMMKRFRILQRSRATVLRKDENIIIAW